MGRSGIWPKGLEDLNVYRHQQAYGEKVREDLNVQRRLGCLARDRPSHYGYRGAFFASQSAFRAQHLLPIKIRGSVQADITAFMLGNLYRLAVVVNMSFWTRYSVRFLDI